VAGKRSGKRGRVKIARKCRFLRWRRLGQNSRLRLKNGCARDDAQRVTGVQQFKRTFYLARLKRLRKKRIGQKTATGAEARLISNCLRGPGRAALPSSGCFCDGCFCEFSTTCGGCFCGGCFMSFPQTWKSCPFPKILAPRFERIRVSPQVPELRRAVDRLTKRFGPR
jgi:hypothetical protein